MRGQRSLSPHMLTQIIEFYICLLFLPIVPIFYEKNVSPLIWEEGVDLFA